MEPGEHEAMSRAEERHWWYLGLRELLAGVLAREVRVPKPRVLDAGCGTGANLRLLRDALAPAYLGGFDTEPEALRLAHAKVPEADLYRSDACAPELHVDALDLVLSIDVIYVPGSERARPGLLRLAERLARGGLLVLHLPAYRWLYSEHDAAVHGTQRFTAREVRALLAGLGLRVELLTYRLCLLFPLVVLARLPRLARPGAVASAPRSELHDEPDPRVNRALLAALRAENAAILRGARLPFGSSVLAVARKP
jgi:SAM-dependent methyltransferase